MPVKSVIIMKEREKSTKIIKVLEGLERVLRLCTGVCPSHYSCLSQNATERRANSL